MSCYSQIGLFENRTNDLDSLSYDVHLIQQTLQGWTSIFNQLMEISIQTHKQNQSNTALLQQLMIQLQPKSKQSQPKDQIKLSPIRPTKTEPDEYIKPENFSRIFNNHKKISIMQLQGTPFDSAFESINKELEEPIRDDLYLSVPKSMQLSNDNNMLKKNQQLDFHPQSVKNTYENRQFAFNKPIRSQDIKSNKENTQNQYTIHRQDSKRNQDYPQLSTVLEENPSLLMTSNENNYRHSITQSHRQYDQCSIQKHPQNSQRPPNYYQQQQHQSSENNRSSSKSCYGAASNLQQQILTNNINIVNSQQNLQLMQQQQSTQNHSQNNLISQSTKNIKQNHFQNNNVSIKLPIDTINQISSQRAKSYSEQTCKKQVSKRLLDIDIFDKKYETSQELIWKTQKNKI
ncbi:unnamed protein product [Paramecium octaurelia]|uniref:Uncharacterized protein n=1 Tax=Paramecium octaurelia TaxID=43137 RepID=A0A8S1RXZ0_PAROT|nr:unnamed protein product [Paramecium octaurelia]